ncbi:MAG: hypothetical protein ACOYW9_10535 [Deinococcota bacterium]|uniref:Uncharacterized protein n=1 Tax=Allomeiothermus silvanus (strain ATCC 700542 / DSM 9946 / NBRC 106475 / NCIMB 13440 / VI-R2) TaxID=526227 RepID=D7BBD4_ALLS1|nr:hypothetical protein [Allomeiothermus silvanus]ADH62694.1 hypothetical protein Mesil_0781 [Allomeiothermus silvanus DSM 9946]MBI5813332.1 hypothetical protein [Allomeiothermus silvanus]MCL6568975.1 hypothetical protein [Allomeiothermus silvanus]
MERVKREVWQDVEVHLELSLEFDPEAFQKHYPGLALVMAELLIGPPRLWRDPAELLPYAGLKSLGAKLPRLRLNFLETRRLGQALDKWFTALEFEIVGQKVLAVPPPGPIELPEGWRAKSGVWLCHQPLAN